MRNFLIHKGLNKAIVFFLFGTILFSSCKESTILPPDLVPPIDNINTFQKTDLQIITRNVYQDSILTGGTRGTSSVYNASSFYHALGTISNDPDFGRTVASIHVEPVPPNNVFVFKGSNAIIDSVVLALPFQSSFGDTISAVSQTFNVYRSLKRFPKDSAQYEITKDSIDGQLMASQTVNFSTFRTDSPLVGTVKLVPQLRFRLNSWFADSLNAQIALGANGAMATISSYLDWWNGFYITPSDTNSGNTIGYFNTYGTRLYIYYRNTNLSGGQDTTNTIFGFDPNNSNRFNRVTRNYIGSKSSNYINTNKIEGDSILFLQSSPGLAAVFSFPDLTTVDNHIVNKAELLLNSIVPTNMMTDSLKAGLIPRLYAFKTDSIGNDKVLTDYTSFTANYVDGRRYTVSIFGMTFVQYKFILTESFQRAISEKDTTFRIKILGNNIGLPAAYQSVLTGSGSQVAILKPKLNLIYTKIK